MTISSNRWLLLPTLMLSGVLWLGISSVTANAVHVLAKSNFALRPFGSVSAWLVASAIIWPLIASHLLKTVHFITAKRLFLGVCAVLAWTGVLVVLTAVGDEVLGKLGGAAIAVWILEVAMAFFLLRVITQPLLSNLDLQGVLVGTVAALASLTMAKGVLLCIFPGVEIRM